MIFCHQFRSFDWESVDIEAPLSALLDPTGASSQRNAANWGTLCIIKLRSGVFNLCCGFTVMPVKPSDHASNIFNPCRCHCAEESGKAGVTWDIHTLKGGVTSHPALQCSYSQVCEMFGHPTTLLDPGLQSAARRPATLCRLHWKQHSASFLAFDSTRTSRHQRRPGFSEAHQRLAAECSHPQGPKLFRPGMCLDLFGCILMYLLEKWRRKNMKEC